ALPAAGTVAYDLLLWFVNHVGTFPRSHRFVLGERIETAMLEVMLGLVRAASSRDRMRESCFLC
ncbi:MAG: four helix bundle protein, partial [Nitrospirota bacterium]